MTDPHELTQQLQFELMLLSRYQLRPHHTEETVLERSAFILLSRLELSDPMTLKELAQALHLDTSTVHRQVGALLRADHVGYVVGLAGEVARRLAPTPAGLRALDDTRASYVEGLRPVVGDWPDTRVQDLLTLIRELNQSAETLEATPWPRPSGPVRP